MTGKFTSSLVAACILVSVPSLAFASCDEFIQESDGIDGVVPRFNEDGSVRSLLSYGEATFLVAKRSLISSARKEAVLTADRNFASFMEKHISGASGTDSGLDQSEITNQSGETEGTVEERKVIYDTIQSVTPDAILNGLVTLDECVDAEEKFLIIERGWKRELSEAAAEASKSMHDAGKEKHAVKSEESIQERAGTSESNDKDSKLYSDSEFSKPTKIKPAKGYRAKSSIKDTF